MKKRNVKPSMLQQKEIGRILEQAIEVIKPHQSAEDPGLYRMRPGWTDARIVEMTLEKYPVPQLKLTSTSVYHLRQGCYGNVEPKNKLTSQGPNYEWQRRMDALEVMINAMAARLKRLEQEWDAFKTPPAPRTFAVARS